MGVRWSRMSWSEKNELWGRWHRGESLRDIAQALRRAPSVVYVAVEAQGGIAPRPRRRSQLALTTTEREEISRQLAGGHSLRAISRLLDRAPSTVSREVARNGGRGVYRAAVADGHAWRRSRRPQPCRLSTRPALRRASRKNSLSNGRPSKSRGGSDVPFGAILTCRCRPKRFTGVCSFRVGRPQTSPSAAPAPPASLSARARRRAPATATRPNPGCHLDSPATGGSPRSRCAWALGR